MHHYVYLRDVTQDDLPIFYQHQLDPEATQMAGFPSRDWDTFLTHWKKILADENNINQTIVFDEQVAGNIACFEQAGERDTGYWLGKEFWGKGIATQALTLFLAQVTERPLYARVVKTNVASKRVLEKCGYRIIGEDAEEFILRLD